MSKRISSQKLTSTTTKQMSLSSFLGCPQSKNGKKAFSFVLIVIHLIKIYKIIDASQVCKPAVRKPLNPICLDSDTEEEKEDDKESGGANKDRDIPKDNLTNNNKPNVMVKKYLYEDVHKSPLAPVITKANSSFNDKVKDTRLMSTFPSPSKINFDDIENTYQMSMKALNESIEKINKDRNKYTPVKDCHQTSPSNKAECYGLDDSFNFKTKSELNLEKQSSCDDIKRVLNSEFTHLEIYNEANKYENGGIQKQSGDKNEKSTTPTNSDLCEKQCNNKSKINIVFENGLNDYLCDLMQTHHFKTGTTEVSKQF